jgi:hypothetical protein
MCQISWLSHRCIVELLIVHSIGYWVSLECVEHMITIGVVETRSCRPSITHALSSWSSTCKSCSLLSHQMYWSSVMWGELESLSNVWNRSVKVFSFCFWSIIIVFTSHDLEIVLEITFYHFCLVSLWWLWINWLSSFPIKPKTYEIVTIILFLIKRKFYSKLKASTNVKNQIHFCTYLTLESKKWWSLIPLDGVL